MAIVKFGVIVVGIRKTIGGVTFSANKHGPYAKQWSRGANPKSALQSIQRGILAKIPDLWRDLTVALQAAWNTFAALPAQELTNQLGEAYFLSGFGWFTKINTRLLVMGRAPRSAVPTQTRPTAPTIDDLEFPFDVGQTAMIAYPSATFDPDFDLILQIAQASSIGHHSPPSNFAEFVVSQNPDDTETGFAAAYTNRLGLGNTTLKGFARLYRQTTDGLRSSPATASFVAVDAPNFAPGALAYDGVADFALRGADLTGSTETKTWTLAAWFKIDAGDGTFRAIAGASGGRYTVRLTSGNLLQFLAEDNTGSNIVTITADDPLLASSAWHSLLFSVDTETERAALFIDDAAAPFTTGALSVNALIDFVQPNHSLGARSGGDQFWDGCLSNYWMSITEALDFSDVAIRRAFLSPAGDPLDLGTSGQLPTGTVPIIYFPDGDASANEGDGGNFTNQAGSAACSDAP